MSKLPKLPKIKAFYQLKNCWKAGKPGSWQALKHSNHGVYCYLDSYSCESSLLAFKLSSLQAVCQAQERHLVQEP